MNAKMIPIHNKSIKITYLEEGYYRVGISKLYYERDGYSYPLVFEDGELPKALMRLAMLLGDYPKLTKE